MPSGPRKGLVLRDGGVVSLAGLITRRRWFESSSRNWGVAALSIDDIGSSMKPSRTLTQHYLNQFDSGLRHVLSADLFGLNSLTFVTIMVST